MNCTFFGHRNVHKEIEPRLRAALIDVIENHGADVFYVGNQGQFDSMALRLLNELSLRYPIKHYVVLAYLPDAGGSAAYSAQETIFPEGLETVPRRFAVVYRNKWMLRRSEIVITHVVNHVASGAARFKELAEKHGKTVVNIE